MKKIVKRFLAIVLSLIIVLISLCGCSSKGKTLMQIEDTKLSVNMFQFFLSRMKGTISATYGEQALRDSFWDTVVSTDGTTYNDYFTEQTLNSMKIYLAALYMFEDEGLELPDSYIEEIDDRIDDLIEQDANGSKNEFNAMLSEFGVNYKMLREAYIIEAKVEYLNDYLFGSDGSKISPTLMEEYYQDNYVHFKQVFIYTYALLYDTDEYGNEVYYDATNSKRISYDKSAVKSDKTDKNGDFIYLNEEGEIAYDKKNGKRNPVLDDKGNQLTREYTKEELMAASDRAQIIFEECKEENYTLFDTLVEDYSEDIGMTEFPNGYYITAETEYASPEVVEALFGMEEGEIKKLTSDYGIHIVMKYKLDEGGYADSQNADFFLNSEGTAYKFIPKLKEKLLADYLEKYMSKIEIDEEILATVDIKSVGANTDY